MRRSAGSAARFDGRGRARSGRYGVVRAAVLVSFLCSLAACASEPIVTPGVAHDAATEVDTAVAEDTAPSVPDAPIDSGCPAPRTVSPEQLPSGFLPPERVNLYYTVDGDTAHFYFSSGEHVVRFLYVNTEEVNGPEKTALGDAAKVAIDGFLKSAKEITVAVEKTSAGEPHSDPFGRWLGVVFVDGDLLETRIVREGHSAYYTAYGCAAQPIHDALLHAEAEAWAAKRGIWAPGNPTDYEAVLKRWMGKSTCRPSPYLRPYCI